MRSRLLIPALLFSVLSLKAQHDLSGSERNSPFVYAFQLSDKEALYLYNNNMKDWEKKNLHTLTDSFPSDQTQDPHLPPGNYLFIQARGSYLNVTLRTIGSLRYDLLNNGVYAALSLRTADGTMIRDAEVHVRHRQVAFDPANQNYPLGRWRENHSRPVKVVYQSAVYYFPVTHNGSSWHPHSRSWYWWHGKHKYNYRYRYTFSDRTRYENRFHSFLVFSKPKYKPGDTVQGKAFVMDKGGRPIERPLALRLSNRNLSTDTIIAYVHPYGPGGYTFSFVLNDSLDLRLDDDYQVTLEDGRKPRRSKDDEDDDDDEKTAARRKVVARGTFTYEEYELQSIQFHARVDKTTNSPGEPVSVFLQATDENSLPVADGRVEIRVSSDHRPDNYLADTVFIPDSLWTWTQPLDPVGETRIIIPDSIFPRASFPYTIHCQLLNSNNELHEEDLQQHYLGDTGRIFFHQHRDSMDIDYQVRGRAREKAATLYQMTPGGDTIGIRTLTLPASFPINSYTDKYVVRIKEWKDSITSSYKITETPLLSLGHSRSRDSIRVYIQNYWGIHFWYTLSVDGKVVREGFTDQLDYRAETMSAKPYLLRLQYVWQGKINRQDLAIPFQEKLLHIDIKEPLFVYPGQKANIAIGVKDANGKPVPDADLTTWSVTSKFTDFKYPSIPYLGKKFRYSNRYDYTRSTGQASLATTSPLDWGRWSRQMGLDTIEYYKFLHPATIYVNREKAADGVTQIAPFVSRKGQLQPVELLYIDEQLVYCSQAQQVQRYSFPVAAGRHSLRLRLRDKEIRLDSMQAELWTKTFICINDDTANKAIRSIKKPATLTWEERALLNSSLLLLENSFGSDFATVSQDPGRQYLVNAPGSQQGTYGFLVGPFTDRDNASLRVEDGFEQDFDPDGGYLFHIQPGLVREKQWPASYPFYPLGPGNAVPELRDRVLTRHAINQLWQDYVDQRSATQDLYRNPPLSLATWGSLVIGSIKDSGNREAFVKKVFLFRYDDPDYMRIYKGIDRWLGNVEPSTYRLLLLLKHGRYLLRDSVLVQRAGVNYYGFGAIPVHEADSFSRRIDSMLRVMEKQQTMPESWAASSIRTAFNDYNENILRFGDQVSGRVTDNDGRPIANVTVHLKDTRKAVATDANGNFHMNVPKRGTLVFSYIGYNLQEKKVIPRTFYAIKLSPAVNALNEVVVVGYGVQRKRDMTGSVTTVLGYSLDATVSPLMGKVAGLSVTNNIYGSRAMSWDTTTITPDIPSLAAPMTGSTLRRRFRDDAFWQPRLRTDAAGTASFTVQYPDDITSWMTYAVAVTADRQSGMTQGSIRAFKPLSANLSTPAFLVAGDQARVIGKVLNYTPDTVTITRKFQIDGAVRAENQLSLLNAHIDTFDIHPVSTDSLHFLYSLRNTTGYSDGEERSIPVFPAGTRETRGVFAVLEEDTGIRLHFDTTLGPVNVYASASLLPVLLDEIESIRSYEYLCNEQIASKLMALLQKKRILALEQTPFREEDNVRDLIARLLKARRGAALWGWWPEAPSSAWISLHVTEALLMAQKEGYSFQLDKQAIIDYLIHQLENDPSTREGAFRIRLLQELGAHADYKKYIDSLENRLKTRSLYQTLQLQELRQTAGLPTRLDTLIGKRQYTALGNCYWGEDSLAFFDNAIQNTVLMYRLLKATGGHADWLKKMRDYLLEKRGSGHWRNTYESSLILETLLPDLLEEGHPARSSTLTIGGRHITSFPYQERVQAGGTLEVSETGRLPVYFTAWQQLLNKTPEKVTGTFAVRSWFEKDGVTLDRLRAGVPVTLEVEVEAKGDADYVMVEVPIPAGCGYLSKEQGFGGQEIHREYLKNKLSIFCLYLGKGRHRFSVSLLPRYTGSYHLNPAKAEMMYFPVLYGREAMRTISIE